MEEMYDFSESPAVSGQGFQGADSVSLFLYSPRPNRPVSHQRSESLAGA